MKSASLDASVTAGIFGGSTELHGVGHMPTSSSASAFQAHKAASQSVLSRATGYDGQATGHQQTVASYRPKLGVVTTRSFSNDTDLDGLGNDQIEALLRSETTEVLEEELDDFFNEDSSSLLRSSGRGHQQSRTTRISGPGATNTTTTTSGQSNTASLTTTTTASSHGNNIGANNQAGSGNSTTMIITSGGGRAGGGSNSSLETSV